MKRAHQIAKEQLEGDYQARLSLALKIAWEEVREMEKELVIEDWWLRENPGSEAKINGYSDIEVVRETEKAILVNGDKQPTNDGVWIPKSVAEWKEVSQEEIKKEEIEQKLREIDISEKLEIKKTAKEKIDVPKFQNGASQNPEYDKQYYQYIREELEAKDLI